MRSDTVRYCLALDLKDDPVLKEAYIAHHQKVWPGILENIRAAGIVDLEIYCFGSRLFMIMEAGPEFSFEKKALSEQYNEEVQAWERLMETYQQQLPGTMLDGGKWKRMDRIFSLEGNFRDI